MPFDSYKVFTGTHNAAKKKFYALTRVDQFLVDGIVYPSLDMMLTINYNPDDTNCDLNTFLEEPIASFTRIDYLNGDLASFV